MELQKSTMTVLAQVMSWIPDRVIENLAKKYKIQTRSFSATSHVMSMLYAHLSHALSLNDVCDSIVNHIGSWSQIRGCTPPSRNGLSHANKTRNADMAEELFWKVYESLSKQYPDFLSSSRNYPGLPYRFRKRTIRAVDSTTIKLTAFSMGWAKHRRQKAAAKMHTALNMRSFLPNFVIVKSAHDSDPITAWELCAGMKAGEVVTFDKAYVDFKHLKTLADRDVSWVTRSKENMVYEVVGQQVSAGGQNTGIAETASSALSEADVRMDVAGNAVGQQVSGKRKHTWKKCRILADEHIRLTGVGPREHYPEEIRLVTAEVEVKEKMTKMTFITNNFEWSAFTICQIYQCRWGVEVFFKEIKQTLQLTDFLGYNENAVRWQVWTALLAYLLLRFLAWFNIWKHPFTRLFTLIRAVLWNFYRLDSVIECCDTPRERKKRVIRGSPEMAYQPTFW